ncbi:hypothetical protein ACPUER_27960 [Burkholderia sp. DN3021]|uniref:hypothetical protein n=1 Tax=Burkholderia TaxID=32008 RepID=UPI00158AF36F|nr:hypothetical protein [Burkholderia pyrrocinia]
MVRVLAPHDRMGSAIFDAKEKQRKLLRHACHMTNADSRCDAGMPHRQAARRTQKKRGRVAA